MTVFSRGWWMVIAAILLVLASLFAPEIQVGELTVRRTDPDAFLLFVSTGVFGIALLVGVALLARRHPYGLLLCQWWGALYSVAILATLYVNFALRDPLPILIMVAFSAAWYWGTRRSAIRDIARQA